MNKTEIKNKSENISETQIKFKVKTGKLNKNNNYRSFFRTELGKYLQKIVLTLFTNFIEFILRNSQSKIFNCTLQY